jgi:hypothetical protein
MDSTSGASKSVRQMLHSLKSIGFEIEVIGCTVFDSPLGVRGLGVDKLLEPNQRTIMNYYDNGINHELVLTRSTDRDLVTSDETQHLYDRYISKINDFEPDVIWFYGGRVTDHFISDEARSRGIAVMAYLANGNYSSVRWCRDVDLVVTDSEATAKYYEAKMAFKPVAVGKFLDPSLVVANHHSRTNLTFVNPSPQKGSFITAALALEMEMLLPEIEIDVFESRGSWEDSVRAVTQQREGRSRNRLSNVNLQKNRSDIRSIYEKSRVLLVPSLWWESGSRVIVEAAINGVPSIVTKRGGNLEMMGDGGVAIDLPEQAFEPPYNFIPKKEYFKGFVALIDKLWTDQGFYLKLVNAAYENGLNRHSIKKSLERLSAAIEQTIKTKKPASSSQKKLKQHHKYGLLERNFKKDTYHTKVLILTLTTDEPQLKRCRESVANQKLLDINHRELAGLANKEAHEALYETIHRERDNYKYFLKLDADMELASNYALYHMVQVLEQDKTIDHLVIPIDDWASGGELHGVHLFSNRVQWERNDSSIFVDPDPKIAGQLKKLDVSGNVYIRHMYEPSLKQCFLYGLQRGIKYNEAKKNKALRDRLNFYENTIENCLCEYRKYKYQEHIVLILGFLNGYFNNLSYNELVQKNLIFYQKTFEIMEDQRSKIVELIDALFLDDQPLNVSLQKCRLEEKNFFFELVKFD